MRKKFVKSIIYQILYSKKNWFLVFIVLIFEHNLCYAQISNSIDEVQYFTGREKELKVLKKYLLSKERIINVNGFTGIGKTQLVRKLVSEIKSYYDIIWWFDCRSDIYIQSRLLREQIYKKLKDKRNDGFSNVYQDNEILNIIAHHKLRTLFIYDDFKEKRSCQGMISQAITDKNVSQILISRSKIEATKTLSLQFFTQEEALKYIKRRYNSNYHKEKHELEELAQLLSYHPLSLTQAISFLNQNSNITTKLYLKNIKEKNIEFLKKNYINNLARDEYKTSLISALHNSFEQIKKENILSYEMLKISSYLDNKFISNKLFKKIYNIKSKNKSLLGYLEAINPLIKYSIINVIDEQGNNVSEKDFVTHDLVQSIILDGINDKKVHKENLSQIMYALLSTITENERKTPDYSSECIKLIPTIEKVMYLSNKYEQYLPERFILSVFLLNYYVFNGQYTKMNKVFAPIDKELSESRYSFNDENMKMYLVNYLISKAIYYDSGFSDYQKSIEALNEAKGIIKPLKKSAEVIETKYFLLLELAQIYLYAGNIQATKVYLDEIEKELNPIINQHISNGIGNYYFIKAKLFLELGEYNKAREYVSRCIKQVLKVEGYNIYTFPVFLLEADIELRMNNISKAYNLITKLNEDFDNSNDKEMQLKGRILTTMSAIKLRLSEFRESEKDIKKAIEIFNKVYEVKSQLLEQNDDLAASYMVYGDIKKAQNYYKEALEYYLKAEKIYSKRYQYKLKLDITSILLHKISNIASKLGDKYLVIRYFNLHNDFFGIEHDRTRDMYFNALKFED